MFLTEYLPCAIGSKGFPGRLPVVRIFRGYVKFYIAVEDAASLLYSIQGAAENYWIRLSYSELDWTELIRAAQRRAEQSRAEQSRAEQSCAVQK